MPAQVKIDAVKELREKFSAAQSVVLADYRGLNVEQMTELRAQCRAAGVDLRVAKNRLAKLALRELGLPALDSQLTGPTIFAIGVNDPVSPAKALSEFAKKNDRLAIKGGLIGKEVANAASVAQLATLPSKEELIARMAGSIAAPSTKIAIALNQVVSGLARAIRAVAEQKQAA